MHHAIILAGGQGERLRPLTNNVPKPLLRTPVVPIIEYQLDALYECGVHTVYILIHASQYSTFSEFVHQCDLRHALTIKLVPEADYLGTGGALARCIWDHGELSRAPGVLVLNGDIACSFPFRRMLKVYSKLDCRCLLTHISVNDVTQYGQLVLGDAPKKPRTSATSEPSSEAESLTDSLLCSTSDASSEKSDSTVSDLGASIKSSSTSGLPPRTPVRRKPSTSQGSQGDTVDVRQVKRIDAYHRLVMGSRISRYAPGHRPSSPTPVIPRPTSSGKKILPPREKLVRAVLRFVEKPRNDREFRAQYQPPYYANAGLYVLHPTLLLRCLSPCSLEHDVIPALLDAGVSAYSLHIGTDADWSDMGTLAGLIRGCRLLHLHRGERRGATCVRVDSRGNVVDAQADIHEHASVHGCLFYAGAAVPDNTYLEGCIVLPGARIPAGRSHYGEIFMEGA
ncbi:Mannose-1-phosphate guanyltransferase [Giardia muris]|uniref:Mannose-1-phosphate guanyltransferase n=1 Tax=Giardia muris TaxID=5742 RepID=A0A4Z1T782_GIAMU|nr:Mannose-1-phosphate guanyltransferase [Giardia muris]|eukprot:TNJ29933.1 Mannose-1-phosphate guanyltransferase [Giardia muris]